jgi:hypothetical protein
VARPQIKVFCFFFSKKKSLSFADADPGTEKFNHEGTKARSSHEEK